MTLPHSYDRDWPKLLDCAVNLARETLEAKGQAASRQASPKLIAELKDENQLSACVLSLTTIRRPT